MLSPSCVQQAIGKRGHGAECYRWCRFAAQRRSPARPSGRTDHFTGLTIDILGTSPGAELHEKGSVLRVRMGDGAFGSVYAASRNGHPR